MAFSGLDIYKLLPKTNCRECGFATCLAFAMSLAKKAVSIDKCPYVAQESKEALEASSQPPIKLITLGVGESALQVGNETVMFRHEEKFHRPCGIGFIIEDSLSDKEIVEKLHTIETLSFERVGQNLEVNMVALKQCGNAKRFVEVLKLVAQKTKLPLVLMSDDVSALTQGLNAYAAKRPLLYRATNKNTLEMANLAKQYKVPLVVWAKDLESLESLTQEVSRQGAQELILDTGEKALVEKLWDLTQIRRLALKKSNRAFGFPVLAVTQSRDFYEEAMEAATYISKYASLILLHGTESWEILALLTLRQNVYTDPQKPLQIEPGLYPVGQVTPTSPLLITTNFSLSYYTVLGEVEASRVPAHILSVDTEGMSVLTAWAAEKFNAEKINAALDKFSVREKISNNRVVVPGYVAVLSGDLEDLSGCKVIVGPKEAAGIPSFLKNL